jgi:hypothetical protein
MTSSEPRTGVVGEVAWRFLGLSLLCVFLRISSGCSVSRCETFVAQNDRSQETETVVAYCLQARYLARKRVIGRGVGLWNSG